MKKKLFTVIVMLTVSLLLLAAGLSCSNGKITAALGQEFTIPAGQTAAISGEDLSLQFIEVTADSRCPKGAECIWAGEAKCRMRVTYQGSVSEMILTLSAGTINPPDLFNKYALEFQLEPYPELGKKISDSDYELLMTITKM
jgi:hypothetical protein